MRITQSEPSGSRSGGSSWWARSTARVTLRNPEHVDVEHCACCRVADFLDRAEYAMARVVHQDIDAAESGKSLGYCGGDTIGVGDVDGDCQGCRVPRGLRGGCAGQWQRKTDPVVHIKDDL
jgi:hypothetical protein